ncbi:MAG: DUF3710 domain-containing protein [Streptosporangiales bacterium]|nr:DUF3710 domain-containing protein [Streptosporangiales bacterium]
MFGRRRKAKTEAEETQAQAYDAALDDELDEEGADALADAEADASDDIGPWDADDDLPEIERVDLGGIQVPMADGFEIQVNVADEQVVAVSLVHPESETAVQVQAFSAPKTSGLWDDVRREIAAELKESGGESEETEGPFGTELRAVVPVEVPDEGVVGQPARFIGVDGPRWFLRGVISGRGAADPETAGTVEGVFSDIVVVRGEEPMPPRDLLPIKLPADAEQAMAEAAAQAEAEAEAEADSDRPNLQLAERGPEITEIR